jgi:hypothetical protein
MVYEGESLYEKLHEPEVVVGDTIEYAPHNQQGYVKYKVIVNENGEKEFETIDSYDMQMDRMNDETPVETSETSSTQLDEMVYESPLGKRSNDITDENSPSKRMLYKKGGKRKTHKKRSNKRKMSKKRSHKRKTRKNSKKRTNKRK